MEGKARFLFPVVITAIFDFVVSGALTFFNIGWRNDFVIRWWSAFAIGWPIAASTAYLAIPSPAASPSASSPPSKGPEQLLAGRLDVVFARRLLGTSHGRLAEGRLRQVEPLRGAMETAAIGHRNKGTQQLEIQHAIDPILRSIIL